MAERKAGSTKTETPDPALTGTAANPARLPEQGKQRREGMEEGYPQARYDGDKRQWYHLDGNGERVYHERPKGVRFDEQGRMVRQPEGQQEAREPDRAAELTE